MDKYVNLIEGAFSSDLKPCTDPTDHLEWARFGFHAAFHLFQKVRNWQYKVDLIKKITKPDGSPTTALEFEMESYARETLMRFYPPAVFFGEESGGDLDQSSYLLVLDPIDGTRSFLSGFDTYSITLSIIKDHSPVFSLVCAPASGEMYFRAADEASMVFQVPLNGRKPELFAIPLFVRAEEKPILVNLHPSRQSLPYLESLFELWQKEEISLLKSVSGSPSLLMVEAAKTSTYYINTWDDAPTQPYDLIPAVHIIHTSGFQAIRRGGEPIDPWNHQGFYIAGPAGRNLHMLCSKMQIPD